MRSLRVATFLILAHMAFAMTAHAQAVLCGPKSHPVVSSSSRIRTVDDSLVSPVILGCHRGSRRALVAAGRSVPSEGA